MERIKETQNNHNAINNVMGSEQSNNGQAVNIERLGGTALLWLSMHDTTATIKVLRECEEKADEPSREILKDIATMITQFKKDLGQ